MSLLCQLYINAHLRNTVLTTLYYNYNAFLSTNQAPIAPAVFITYSAKLWKLPNWKNLLCFAGYPTLANMLVAHSKSK